MLPGIKQFDLTGRVALVTGGSKGLGAAMAAGLASAGADLVLASRTLSEVEEVAAEIARDYGHQAIGVAAVCAWSAVASAAILLLIIGIVMVAEYSSGIIRKRLQ